MNNQFVNATIKIDIDEALLEVIETALKPEADMPSSDRSETSIFIEMDQLIIKIQASDTTALRAAINSYLRWVQGIMKIIESIK